MVVEHRNVKRVKDAKGEKVKHNLILKKITQIKASASNITIASALTSEYSSSYLLTSSSTKYLPYFSLKQHEMYKRKLSNFIYFKKHEHFIKIDSWEQYLEKAKDSFLQRYRRVEAQKNVSNNDFDIIKLLNNGSFSEVLMAMKHDSEHFYAIKKINKKLVVRNNFVSHVKAEKNILEALNFPFVISMDYFYQTVKHLYYVMPLMIGHDLCYLLESEEKLKETAAKFYISQIILSLEYLHHTGMIHRDIKPENVALDVNGYVKIIDFGFCKLLNGRAYTMCGTPEYMAPEILQNQGYGKSVDWWSLGILAYELCCGYTPFKANSNKHIFLKILKGTYVCPVYFSNELKDFIGRILVIDLTKRFGFINNSILYIKSHEWLSGVNWNGIINRGIASPFIPQINKLGKLQKIVIEESDETDDINSKTYEKLFKDF